MAPRPAKASFAALAAAALGALALTQCGGGAPAAGEGYSVVLISLDSTRQDMLSTYGHDAKHAPGVPSTPNLDRLTAEGVRLTNAYATTSWTLPSHMTLLTGQPELVHAVEIDWLTPDPERHTLASVLQARGYATSGFFTGPYLDPRFGFARGFDVYESCFGPDLAAATERLLDAERRKAEAEARGDQHGYQQADEEARAAEGEVERLSHRDLSSKTVIDRSIEAIDAAHAAGQPFFVFAHFFDPHYDYIPPAEHDLFDPDYDGPITGDQFWMNEDIALFVDTPSGRQRVVDERGLEHILALYAGELRWTDAEIGRLLTRLDELELTEKTMVIITSDHGDEFFEHGAIGHRRTLHEEVVRVPMMFRMPGVLPAGAEVDALVSNVDVFNTVLELLAIPGVPGTHSESMAALLQGQDEGEDREVLGRLIKSRGGGFQAEPGADPVLAQIFTVDETYRVGRIKIQRLRQWPERTSENVSPQVADDIDKLSRAEREKETLRWIDVELFPEEPEHAWSTDFTSGPQRDALRRFHDRYPELLRDRFDAGINDSPIPGLAGLGYAGDGPKTTVGSDRFVLPPPGAELFGE